MTHDSDPHEHTSQPIKSWKVHRYQNSLNRGCQNSLNRRCAACCSPSWLSWQHYQTQCEQQTPRTPAHRTQHTRKASVTLHQSEWACWLLGLQVCLQHGTMTAATCLQRKQCAIRWAPKRKRLAYSAGSTESIQPAECNENKRRYKEPEVREGHKPLVDRNR
jgi:hypothetical protein